MSVERVFRGTGLRIIALIAAIVIWFGVSSERREQQLERSYEVPIALVGVPRDVIVMEPVQEAIGVRLRGPLRALRSLSSQNLEITIDLRDAKPGSLRALIRPQALNVPPNVEVISLEPASISFRIESRRNKNVPIRPFLVGQLREGLGYSEESMRVEPPTALVSGPASAIRELEEVFTDRIVLSGRSQSFRQTVGVLSDVPLVRVLEPQTAVVTVEIAEKPPEPEPKPKVRPGAKTRSSKGGTK
ncbi:MAG: CdaR family protein [Thermoanaerobaculia bacterium]